VDTHVTISSQKKRSRFASALQYEFAVIFVALLTLLLMFFLLGDTSIPVKEFKTSMNDLPVRAIPDDFDIHNLEALNVYASCRLICCATNEHHEYADAWLVA
jgi:hypothetical protein